MDIILMLLGFGLLVIGGEFLVRASVALSFKLNISKMVVGKAKEVPMATQKAMDKAKK